MQDSIYGDADPAMTLAQRLLILVALALLPPFAAQVWTGLQLMRTGEAALSAAAMAETRDAQANIGRTTEGVRQLLLALAEIPFIRRGDAEMCGSYLTKVVSQFGSYGLLAVTATDGGIICSSAGAKPGDYSNAGRAYFKRAMSSDAFSVGDLVTGTVTHVLSINFALPFRRLDGTAGGIVLASINQAWLSRELASQALPAAGLVMLVDPGGTVVAGSVSGQPVTDGWVGRPAPPDLLAALRGKPGTVNATGPDGILRLFGVVPPDPALRGMTVAVGFSDDGPLAAVRGIGLRNAAALLLGAVLAVAACIVTAKRFILRPLARLAETAERVGAGELGARAELDTKARELRVVGAAFDKMSDAIAVRERSLLESEARFRHMADSAPALIWMTGPAGKLSFANLHFTHLFGRSASDMEGNGWASIMVTDDLPVFRAAFVRAFTDRAAFRTEARVRCRDGSVRWLRCEGVPRSDDAGTFLGYTGCAVDVTEARLSSQALEGMIAERTADLQNALDALNREMQERARAEDTLRQSQKMEAIGQLTGGIAHDFNNMLQGISGALSAIQRRVRQGRAAEIDRFAEGAIKTVERAAALTNRLLAFARRQALRPIEIDPDILVAGLADLIRRTVGPGVRVEFRPAGSGWLIRCDQSQLENALLNLAINARDAMPDGGTLSISTSKVSISADEAAGHEGVGAGEHVGISVNDTGVGMDEVTVARAFEPFFTTKPHGQGTGLGLSQIYGFLRQSSGLVRLESTPGHGTTVTLLLPKAEALATEREAVPEVRQSGEAVSGCILLIEDEVEVRRTIADYLLAVGYEVINAGSGVQALELLAGGACVDIIVTDVGLPGGLNGRQVADAARERRSDIPVLFITGYAAGALDSQLGPGMRILTKPFEMAELGATLMTMLA